MRNWIFLLLAACLCLPSTARPKLKDKEGSVQLSISSQSAANTADPNNQLYQYAVQVKNVGENPVDITNNQFYVTDSGGGNHYVERLRNAERTTLQPGQTVNFDRIYISVPRDLKPKEMHLAKLGTCPIR